MAWEWVILTAVAAGFAFSLTGIAFRIGERGGASPLQVMTPACSIAFLIFGVQAIKVWDRVDWVFCFWSVATGLTQYGLIKLVKPTLKRGPLSPMWCALMLSFVPTILYAWLFLGDRFTWWGLLSMLAALEAVFAAAGATDTKNAGGESRGRQKVIYGVLLIVLLLMNSEANIANKTLQARTPDFDSVVCVYLALLYWGLIVPAWIEAAAVNRINFRSKYLYLAAGIAAIGSMGGMALQNIVIGYSAALVFTVICASSILFGAVMSVVICKEKRTLSWYLAIFGALAAIFLSQGESIVKIIKEANAPAVLASGQKDTAAVD